MGLVKHDPAELSAGLLEDRLVLASHEHVLEHRRVGDQYGGGAFAKRPPRQQLCTGLRLLVSRDRLGGLSVVEAESDIGSEAVAPRSKPVALAVDERVQWVEKQRSYARDGLAARPLPDEVLEDRHEEALGLSRAGAARDEH